MKKNTRISIVILALVVLSALCSCTVAKDMQKDFTYKDPQTLGGYWNVTMQTGQTFNHVKCKYWGTEDDTAVFETDDGTMIIQSGAVVCVRSEQQ